MRIEVEQTRKMDVWDRTDPVVWIVQNLRMLHEGCGGEVKWWHGPGAVGFVLGLVCKGCGIVTPAKSTDVFLRELRQVAQGERFVASFFTDSAGGLEFVDVVPQE